MKSKFSRIQTIILPIFILIFAFGFGTVLIFAASTSIDSAQSRYLLWGSGFVFWGMGVVYVRHFMLLFNRITLDERGIHLRGVLKNASYEWTDVNTIVLTGKEPESILFSRIPSEAISIEMKNENREVLFVKLYSNMDRIRTALHFIKLRLEQGYEISADCYVEVNREGPVIDKAVNFEKYGNNHLFTINGIFAHGSWVFVVWLFLLAGNSMSITVKIILSVLALVIGLGIFGYQLHFFKLNDQFLVVKNHVWPWLNDTYKIKDLREVVFEEPHKLSTSMRVITNNYETKHYPSGSIKRKSWRRLSKEFSRIGVSVRNEAYFD